MGVLALDKPLGLTSHDVVTRVRRALGTRRVGHSGTLDPLATGVLVVATGQSTKLVQFLTTDSKDYVALVSLGGSTPTLDAEGPLLDSAPVPKLGAAAVEGALASLRGRQRQRPPAYSAVRVGGVRAYAAARAGEALELPERDVSVGRLELLAAIPSAREAANLRFGPTPGGWGLVASGRALPLPAPLGDFPTLVLFASVSAGTYLRSLARDLGRRLGAPAHLAGLTRTRVGRFRLEDAVSLDAAANARPATDLEALDLPRLELDEGGARAALDGKRLPSAHRGLVVLAREGRLVAVAEGDGERLRVRRAWA